MSRSDANPSGAAQQILHSASLTADLPAIDHRIVVLSLVEEAIDHQHLDVKDIFEAAYGDREGSAYWSGWLAEDFYPLYQFIRFLEIHNGKKQDLFYISRSQVLEAFSVAARANPPWLRYVGEIGKQLVRADLGTKSHPQLLAHWEICRGPAVAWLSQHPEFSELTPKLLVAHLRNPRSNTGAPGRPTSKHFIIQEIKSRSLRSPAKMTITDWSIELESWLARSMPGEPAMTAKTIKNNPDIRTLLRDLGLLLPSGSRRPE